MGGSLTLVLRAARGAALFWGGLHLRTHDAGICEVGRKSGRWASFVSWFRGGGLVTVGVIFASWSIVGVTPPPLILGLALLLKASSCLLLLSQRPPSDPVAVRGCSQPHVFVALVLRDGE